ncbi:MAG TPA: hypothetical protein VJZ76_19440 [Thermoanaerobaculia bacterium]|nr:hypothetical protein [Thermoanaerobaculia bacterium]
MLDAYAAHATAPHAALQLSPQSTYFGKFIDSTYKKLANDTGVEIKLEFEPGDKVDATKIGMVQSVRAAAQGAPIIMDPSQEKRVVTSAPGEGYQIDRATSRNNPVYGSQSLQAGEGLEKTAATTPEKTYELGYRYDDNGTIKKKNAWIYDDPHRTPAKSSSMEFETTAVAIDGAQKGTYYGSVKWGWERDPKGVLSEVPFKTVSEGVPSQNFLAPAVAFNRATTRGTLVTRLAPTQVYKLSGSSFVAAFTIGKGTKVTAREDAMASSGKADYVVASVVEGASAGRVGLIKTTDLQDKGDGAETVDLPVPEVFVVAAATKINDNVPPYAEGPALSEGTRVTLTGATKTGLSNETLKWIVVAQGSHTGAAGYVPESVLKKERL